MVNVNDPKVGRVEFDDRSYRDSWGSWTPPPTVTLESAVVLDLVNRVSRLEQMVFGGGLASPTPPANTEPKVIKHMRSGNTDIYRLQLTDDDWVIIKSQNSVICSAEYQHGHDDPQQLPPDQWEQFLIGIPVYMPVAPMGSDADPNFDRVVMNNER